VTSISPDTIASASLYKNEVNIKNLKQFILTGERMPNDDERKRTSRSVFIKQNLVTLCEYKHTYIPYISHTSHIYENIYGIHMYKIQTSLKDTVSTVTICNKRLHLENIILINSIMLSF
jgi:hypothetical protein